MKSKRIGLALLFSFYALILSGCDDSPIQLYGYVQKDPSCKKTTGCALVRSGTLLVNVSSETQQVSVKYTPENAWATGASFAKLDNCVVVSSLDFECDGLKRVAGIYEVEPFYFGAIEYVSGSLLEAYVDKRPSPERLKFWDGMWEKITWPWVVAALVTLMLIGGVAQAADEILSQRKRKKAHAQDVSH